MTAELKVVAVDGGAGTGKSTTARNLAFRKNFLHVDTGSHYRSLTKHLLDAGVSASDTDEYLNLNKLELSTQVMDRSARLLVNGISYPSESLRALEINSAVSSFASLPSVRKHLFEYQRSQVEVARKEKLNGIIMEGRDIGTVIFPDAHLKVFLTADTSIREERRQLDGETDQIVQRDSMDSTRKIAPLVPAPGSLIIDTGELSVDAVIEEIEKYL